MREEEGEEDLIFMEKCMRWSIRYFKDISLFKKSDRPYLPGAEMEELSGVFFSSSKFPFTFGFQEPKSWIFQAPRYKLIYKSYYSKAPFGSRP